MRHNPFLHSKEYRTTGIDSDANVVLAQAGMGKAVLGFADYRVVAVSSMIGIRAGDDSDQVG